MNLYTQLIAGWTLYMITVNILTTSMLKYDFLVIGIAWTIGCLIPCIDVPFFLNAKHQTRKLTRLKNKKGTTIEQKQEIDQKLSKINTHRNRCFHTITVFIICSILIFYLVTYHADVIEKITKISMHYFYWSVPTAMIAGYAFHLLFDCIGYAPMPLFLIFLKDPYTFPIRIKRNSKTMQIITMGLTILFLILAFKTFNHTLA